MGYQAISTSSNMDNYASASWRCCGPAENLRVRAHRQRVIEFNLLVAVGSTRVGRYFGTRFSRLGSPGPAIGLDDVERRVRAQWTRPTFWARNSWTCCKRSRVVGARLPSCMGTHFAQQAERAAPRSSRIRFCLPPHGFTRQRVGRRRLEESAAAARRRIKGQKKIGPGSLHPEVAAALGYACPPSLLRAERRAVDDQVDRAARCPVVSARMTVGSSVSGGLEPVPDPAPAMFSWMAGGRNSGTAPTASSAVFFRSSCGTSAPSAVSVIDHAGRRVADQQVPPVVLEVDQVDPPSGVRHRMIVTGSRCGSLGRCTSTQRRARQSRRDRRPGIRQCTGPAARTGAGPVGAAAPPGPARAGPRSCPRSRSGFLARCGHPLVRREAVPAVRGEHVAPGTAEVARGVTAARRVDKPVYDPARFTGSPRVPSGIPLVATEQVVHLIPISSVSFMAAEVSRLDGRGSR